MASASVIRRNGDITVRAILGRAYSLDVPGAIARSEDRQLGIASASVIRRNGDITIGAILGCAYSLDVPRAIAWSEDRQLGMASTSVIRRNGDITIGAILGRAYSLDIPRAIAWAEDGRNDRTKIGATQMRNTAQPGLKSGVTRFAKTGVVEVKIL